MDPLAKINCDVAAILGWEVHGASFRRWDSDGREDHVLSVPRYTDNYALAWQLVDYATSRQVEYSLFAMIYDRKPLYMASFIRGMSQRTSTGDCPRLATCKAFLMMFADGVEVNGDFANRPKIS